MRRLGILLALLGTVGCEVGSTEDGVYCAYEERRTEGCNSGTFEDWEATCLDLADPRDDLTPDGWCDLIAGDTTECQGGCCVTFEVRNTSGGFGLCP
ncbi:MAG: hypothetical protein AAF602_07180 [Myxococcota bacterium]